MFPAMCAEEMQSCAPEPSLPAAALPGLHSTGALTAWWASPAGLAHCTGALTAWWASLAGLTHSALGPSLPEEPAQPASLTLHCHGAQSLGQGNHLCAHCYCKDLSFSCISLNKISHHIWWIISNSSSASLDLHEFILSGEIKRQFIHFLALLGAVILSSSNIATLSE